jgi:hypothetical protein
MRTKYYTRFLLRSTEHSDVSTELCDADEYSGVVEVKHSSEQILEASEIEALLAQNFEMNAENIELLNWSRLH